MTATAVTVKRETKYLILTLALALGVVSAIVFFFSSEGASKERFEQVTVGMTEASVRDLLGVPDQVVRREHREFPVFYYGGFRRMKWCSMEVYFGADGRVTGKFHDH